MRYATLIGFDGLLPSTYGLSSDGLCKLLNAIRDRYGTSTPKLWGIGEASSENLQKAKGSLLEFSGKELKLHVFVHYRRTTWY